MLRQIELSETELNLVLELLDSEHRQLPSEMHHTDSSAVRDDLRQRLVMVDQIIGRLHKQAAVAP